MQDFRDQIEKMVQKVNEVKEMIANQNKKLESINVKFTLELEECKQGIEE